MVAVDEATLKSLTQQVQLNCDISDARYARDYTMCIYLLKMREMYRWEKGFDYSARLSKDDLGNWLTAREAYWGELEENEYQPITLDQHQWFPFDDDLINASLSKLDLLYSGGIGAWRKPNFFLAELCQTEELDGRTIHVAGTEYARDISAPPAMTRDNHVYVRRESLRRMIWEKVEEWYWKKESEHPMAHLIKQYPFDDNLDSALDAVTNDEVQTLVWHELGEVEAGKILGEQWEEMLSEVGRTPFELLARAVRDHMADTLVTLPRLLEKDNPAALHFYMANLSGMRRDIFPSLKKGYQHWLAGGREKELVEAIETGRRHWRETADSMLSLFNTEKKVPVIEAEGIRL